MGAVGRDLHNSAIRTSRRAVAAARRRAEGVPLGLLRRRGRRWPPLAAAGRTSVPGLWAVGNVVDATASVSVTIGAGALTGGMLNHDLVMQEVQTAVDAYDGEAAW